MNTFSVFILKWSKYLLIDTRQQNSSCYHLQRFLETFANYSHGLIYCLKPKGVTAWDLCKRALFFPSSDQSQVCQWGVWLKSWPMDTNKTVCKASSCLITHLERLEVVFWDVVQTDQHWYLVSTACLSK